jgi:transcriptional regulator with XRE-family HTH domain
MPALEAPNLIRLMDMDAKDFSARLRELREAAGIDQAELARRAKVEQSSISRWESGKREPGVSNLFALAEALGVDPAELLKPPTRQPEAPRRGRPPKSAEGEAPPRRPGKKK